MLNKILGWFYSKFITPRKGGGLKGIGEKSTDFMFGANKPSIKERLKNVPVINRQVEYEYNQGKERETRNWCTIFSAVTELSYLMDYHFTTDEIKEIGHKMIADGKLDPNGGAYLSDAIDYVRRWWNKKYPNKQVESYRIDYTDLELRKMLKSKQIRMTQIGYLTSKELYKDCMDDGIAGKTNYPKGGGHAVSKWGVWIIDNYKGRLKRNRYNFKYFDELIHNGIIFRYGYMFLKKQK